jgi:DNA sulfur modification protein DndC
MLANLDRTTIQEIKREYQSSTCPWVIGFSGGKDSSSLVTLVFIALSELKKHHQPVTIVYSDTGVEIPIMESFTKKTLRHLVLEAKRHNLPINIKIVKPKIGDSFFVKVIGKGYPTPTNKFRWCTDRLRTNPIQAFMRNSKDNEKIVLLGTRKGESRERDRILSQCKTDKKKFFFQVGHSKTKIYAPIVDYSYKDVWNSLFIKKVPKSINSGELNNLYQSAGCNEYEKSKNGKVPRFGCWVCTVIRKDKAMQNLINNGYSKLAPLLEFRNWLVEIRDNPYYRLKKRRNGEKGLGPFTLNARKIILKKLLTLQLKTAFNLISEKEVCSIKKCWKDEAIN